LQIDRHGNRTMTVVEELAASERLRRQVGQIAVPLGLCTEPSNVKARGHGCDYRYRCVGCEHFRTDPSNQAELRDYLHQLLAGRERLAAAVPQLAEWARRDATPSDEEIAALRQLIRHHAALPRPAARHDPRALQGRHPPGAPHAASATRPASMTARGQAPASTPNIASSSASSASRPTSGPARASVLTLGRA
jgi:hypothetical protein